MESILKRKSVRNFTKEVIEHDILKELVHAGISSPTTCGEKALHFIVITDRHMLDNLPADPNGGYTEKASAAILVCADKNQEDKDYPGFSHLDCAAATENILIAATEKGLGTCWCGIYRIPHREKKAIELLKLPENVYPFSLIPIGYPNSELKSQNRYDPTKVHFDKW